MGVQREFWADRDAVCVKQYDGMDAIDGQGYFMLFLYPHIGGWSSMNFHRNNVGLTCFKSSGWDKLEINWMYAQTHWQKTKTSLEIPKWNLFHTSAEFFTSREGTVPQEFRTPKFTRTAYFDPFPLCFLPSTHRPWPFLWLLLLTEAFGNFTGCCIPVALYRKSRRW